MITIDDFSKIEIRIGTALEATKVPEADRLIRLVFDFGSLEDSGQDRMTEEDQNSSSSAQNDSEQVQADKEEDSRLRGNDKSDEIERIPELVEKYPGRDVRQIMSAIAPFYEDPQELVGKQIAVCVNLEPRKFKGYISQGMIMATDTEDGKISLLIPEKKVKPGAKIH